MRPQLWLHHNDRTNAGQEFFDDREPHRNNELPENHSRPRAVTVLDYQEGRFHRNLLKPDEFTPSAMPSQSHAREDLFLRRLERLNWFPTHCKAISFEICLPRRVAEMSVEWRV